MTELQVGLARALLPGLPIVDLQGECDAAPLAIFSRKTKRHLPFTPGNLNSLHPISFPQLTSPSQVSHLPKLQRDRLTRTALAIPQQRPRALSSDLTPLLPPIMDVVLEVLDTFVGDYVYANLHPARHASYDFPPPPSNETVAGQVFSSWTFKPATHWFSFAPSQYAYQSAWPRDNIFRQIISLYFTVWYACASLSLPPVPRRPSPKSHKHG